MAQTVTFSWGTRSVLDLNLLQLSALTVGENMGQTDGQTNK